MPSRNRSAARSLRAARLIAAFLNCLVLLAVSSGFDAAAASVPTRQAGPPPAAWADNPAIEPPHLSGGLSRAVPDPHGLAVFGLGLLCVAFLRRLVA